MPRVGKLANRDDSLGWHAMEPMQGVRQRRARRIDLWREGDVIVVDAAFQDSGSTHDGGIAAIHEYRVHAEISAASGRLEALQVIPHILPFQECPGASIKATRMIGTNIADFRETVIETLPTTQGCTHLNDVLRALTDVSVLAGKLA